MARSLALSLFLGVHLGKALPLSSHWWFAVGCRSPWTAGPGAPGPHWCLASSQRLAEPSSAPCHAGFSTWRLPAQQLASAEQADERVSEHVSETEASALRVHPSGGFPSCLLEVCSVEVSQEKGTTGHHWKSIWASFKRSGGHLRETPPRKPTVLVHSKQGRGWPRARSCPHLQLASSPTALQLESWA